MSDYRPISCDRYAELELAIVRKERLRVAWRTAAGDGHVARLTPLDLRTREHAEYLLAEDAEGRPLEIRLDRILQAQPL